MLFNMTYIAMHKNMLLKIQEEKEIKRMFMFKVRKDHKTFKGMNDLTVETGTLPMIVLRVLTRQGIGIAI